MTTSTAPALKPSVHFTHARKFDNQAQPLKCIVTRITAGRVYWRPVGQRVTLDSFELADAHNQVASVDS